MINDWIDKGAPIVNKLDDDELDSIWKLYDCGRPIDEIAVVLDRSEPRIRYEIKQMENKKG